MDKELERLIERARHYVMTPQDIEEQRIGWAYGQMMDDYFGGQSTVDVQCKRTPQLVVDNVLEGR